LTAQIGNSTASQPFTEYVDNVFLTALMATSGSDPVVLAAGDIACEPTDASYNGGAGTAGACQQRATATELLGAAAVLPLGDTQYYAATLSQFQQVYD